ncbi:alpha/beta hydrolase [Candidatus Saccharibacteria bacterium]|nr:alpha/beta hydrolase [Candidatus Saccharibacteria bacterium]
MKAKLYNLITYFWYKILKHPIKMKYTFDSRNKDAKFTVIFLHGIAATSSTWHPTIGIFEKDTGLKNFRFISLDLLGFGKSLRADWLNYDYEEYNRALLKTIKHLHIKNPIILVGHSMGSLIAANFATEYPEKISRLILISPPVLKPEEVSKLPDKFYQKSYSTLPKIADDPIIKTLATFVQKVSSFRAEYLNTVAFERSMKNIVLNRKNYQLFNKLTIPTTIIHGRFDPLVLQSNLAEIAKTNSDFVKLEQVTAHHDISPSKRDKIKIALKGFLEHETI